MPTKRRVTPKAVTFAPPFGPVEPSKLVDEDAEAVKMKAQEEQREEREMANMSAFDKPLEIQRDVQFGDGRVFTDEGTEQMPPPAVTNWTAKRISFIDGCLSKSKFGAELFNTFASWFGCSCNSTGPWHNSLGPNESKTYLLQFENMKQ